MIYYNRDDAFPRVLPILFDPLQQSDKTDISLQLNMIVDDVVTLLKI